jgi:hypothetical protein
MVSVVFAPLIACASCSQAATVSNIPLPPYPLCFVEETREHILNRIGNITPAPIRRALLIPFFKAPNGQRFVACPFVYQQGEVVALPKERTPNNAQYCGMIALCPGYFPTSINSLFPDTDTIRGKRSQLIEVGKARNKDEALRVLEDWAAVLGSKSFSVTGEFTLLKETHPVKGRYATCDALLSPVQRVVPTRFPLWPYDVGTVVKIELTQDDKQVVDDFIKEQTKRL